MRMMKRTAAALLIAVMTMLLPACGNSAEEVLATVNDVPVTAGDVDQYLPLYAQMTAGIDVNNVTDKAMIEAMRDAALKDLVDMEAIRQYLDGKDSNVVPETRDTEFESFLEQVRADAETQTFMEDNDISEEYLAEFFDNQYYTQAFYADMMAEITDLEERTKTYYDENQAEFTQDQVRASHILVSTKEAAEEILEELKAGADFAALAKERSVDQNSAVSGGDLGYFVREQMVAPFAEASFAAEIGLLEEVVQTDYGFHVIKVEDKRTYTQTYEEAEQSIMYTVLQDAYMKKIEAVRSEMKIDYTEQ